MIIAEKEKSVKNKIFCCFDLVYGVLWCGGLFKRVYEVYHQKRLELSFIN